MLITGLYEAIKSIPVIDTHEHLNVDEAGAYAQPTDILREYLTHYLSSDIKSAGLSGEDFKKVTDINGDLKDRWAIVAPYWEASRQTGYGRAIDIAVRELYGFDGVRGDYITELNDAFVKARKIGRYKEVLRDRCGIVTSINDGGRRDGTRHPQLSRVWRPEGYINTSADGFRNIIKFIRDKFGLQILTLEDWMTAIEKDIDYETGPDMRQLKIGLAYGRTLRFDDVPYEEAKSLFCEHFGRWTTDFEAKGQFNPRLQDFLMHYVMRVANARQLTVQIHTGILEGNGAWLYYSDPSWLNNLFLKYRDVKFDIFHIGYPYHNKLAALAKMFPNVYIDMCWAHIISPAASRQALSDFLDAVPYNKISAFGGDYCFIDGVVGHLEIARRNVARVLEDKMEHDGMGEGTALDIAKAIFYENPKWIFGLDI